MRVYRTKGAPDEAKGLLGRKRRQWIAVVEDGGPLVGLEHWERVLELGTLEDGSAVYAGNDPAAWGTR